MWMSRASSTPAGMYVGVFPLQALEASFLHLSVRFTTNSSWDVELTLNGVTKTVAIPEGTSLLDAAEGVFDDVPSLCRNGVCTTCAAKVTHGSHDSYLVSALPSRLLATVVVALTTKAVPVPTHPS